MEILTPVQRKTVRDSAALARLNSIFPAGIPTDNGPSLKLLNDDKTDFIACELVLPPNRRVQSQVAQLYIGDGVPKYLRSHVARTLRQGCVEFPVPTDWLEVK